MKRCPQCNRVETDATLKFCRVDGATLVNESAGLADEAGTAQLDRSPDASEVHTSILPHTSTSPGVNRPTAPTTVLSPPLAGTNGTPAKPNRRKIGIAIVVIATAAIAATTAVFVNSYLSKKRDQTIESIAVLPFLNESGNAELEYLSDGMTETLINSLSQIPKLSVKARSSVFRYKGKETNPQTIGQALNVQAILNGRVTQRGDQLTLGLELIDAQTENVIWSERYIRKQTDLISLQNEVARDVSQKLKTRLSGADEQRLAKHYTKNTEAYQLYLKGRFYWNKRTGDALKKSIEYFNQAIEKDPTYALAFAGLSDAYGLLPGYSAGTPHESFPKAKAAAEKAVELDDNLAEGHTALAHVRFIYDWNLPEADREYRRAIELNPNYATAHHWYGIGPLQALGRFDEAIAEGKRSIELDPFSLILNADLGDTYTVARQYDKAIEQLHRTVEMDQGFYFAHWLLGRAYVLKGSFPEAIAAYKRAMDLNDDPFVLSLLGHAYARSGKRTEALRTLAQMKELTKRRYVPAYGFALVHLELGDRDQAAHWLERVYQDRSFEALYFKVDPVLDPMRDDPRFKAMLKRLNLPE